MKRAAFLSLLLLGSLLPALAEESKPLKALMVCGGCCHDYEHQKTILSEGISARAKVEWTIVYEGGSNTNDEASRQHRISIYEKPNWWQGYDVILHNECFGRVEDVAFVEGIAAAHKAGVPAVMLHCSSHSYRAAKTDEWRMAVGITSMSHEKARQLVVKTLQAEHPVMRGFPSEWNDPAPDELYKNEKVWETATPLAKAYGEETKKDHVVIWVNQYGKGRVFSTTLGHANATMSSPEYLDLVTRGLLWACNKLKDDGTPAEGYAAAAK